MAKLPVPAMLFRRGVTYQVLFDHPTGACERRRPIIILEAVVYASISFAWGGTSASALVAHIWALEV
ncbi:hypothetical protein K449DRAFT_469148 [Hypoxylon sp. EC38]|nr:hypothetical protein K449DRAFT_469148 [Hypoxylon sp. EC38]